MFKQQGSAVVINLNFGPKANAAYSIATQFAIQTAAVSASLMTALTPALTTITGEGRSDRLKDYAMKACRFSGLLILLLAVPLISEIDYVLVLWLKSPPDCAGGFCIFIVLYTFLESLTTGHLVALSAHGIIGAWQTYECIVLALTCPLAIICYKCGAGLLSIGYVFLVSIVLMNMGRIYFTRKLLDFSVKYWICRVFLPMIVVLAGGMLVGKSVGFLATPSFLRFCLTSLISMLTVLVLGWVFLIDRDERIYLRKRFVRLVNARMTMA